jgi:hypothetical protein
MHVEHQIILNELRSREPIFHRREFGITNDDLLQMTDDEFWEIGASGRIYTREFVIANLLERMQRWYREGMVPRGGIEPPTP